MDFITEMKNKAKSNLKTITLPETSDIRTIQAAETVLKEGIANLILIGDKNALSYELKSYNLDGATWINPVEYDRLDEMCALFADIRKSKGLTVEQARDILIKDPLYFGVMLVKMEVADGMVAGAINATADVLRPSLQILKMRPGSKIVSSVMIMVTKEKALGENGVFAFADIGLNQSPDADELANIAIETGRTFGTLIGGTPRVAMLSHSTKGSAKHPDVDKVVEATRIAKELDPTLAIDGELQVDAALVEKVGRQKAPDSKVAGKANVLVFPDIDAGNIGYKLVQRLGGAEAFGPLTQGIAKPVNDLSRGCSADDIVGVVAITSVQAGM